MAPAVIPKNTDGEMTEENQAVAPADEGESFGSWLRSQREVRQVELQTITQSSKINIRYLEALEQDRFDLLPGQHLRQGLPPRVRADRRPRSRRGASTFYLAASAQDDLEGGIENLAQRSPTRSFGQTVVIVLVLVAIALFLVWRFYPGIDREAAEDMETMAPPATEGAPPPPTPTPLPEQALRVTLEFRATSWVDVYSDGERTVSELRIQGESLTVTADEEIPSQTPERRRSDDRSER